MTNNLPTALAVGYFLLVLKLWYTWGVETLGCTRIFIGFSGALKLSGTLG